MPEQVGKNTTMKGTDKFMRQGHTAGPYANDPTADAKGQAAKPARELKP